MVSSLGTEASRGGRGSSPSPAAIVPNCARRINGVTAIGETGVAGLPQRIFLPQLKGEKREEPQHLVRLMETRRTSRPLGVMLIDWRQLPSPTFMAAVKLGPWIDSTKLPPVYRPDTAPAAE